MNKIKFKKYVKSNIFIAAFEYFQNETLDKSKVKNINYEELKYLCYFTSKIFTTQVKLLTGYSGSVVALWIPMCVWHHTWVRGSNLSGGNNAIGKYAEKPQSQPALEL